MSQTTSHVDANQSATSELRPVFRATIIFSLVLIALALTATFVVQKYQQQPWIETIGSDLLRTNAPSASIAAARDIVIGKHQNLITKEDGKRSDPSYQGGGRSWKVSQPGESYELKVGRGKTQITDINGDVLSIETISVTDTPTLIFIHHDDPDKKADLLSEFVNELVKKNVKLR